MAQETVDDEQVTLNNNWDLWKFAIMWGVCIALVLFAYYHTTIKIYEGEYLQLSLGLLFCVVFFSFFLMYTIRFVSMSGVTTLYKDRIEQKNGLKPPNAII